jgi:anti-sigma B factor antagonist
MLEVALPRMIYSATGAITGERPQAALSPLGTRAEQRGIALARMPSFGSLKSKGGQPVPEPNVNMTVRHPTATASIIDIQGDITTSAEAVLMEAYAEANTPETSVVILNFSGLGYMNSSGIGLLVTLMIRLNRQKQRILAYGLNEHYQHIFEVTRLNEAIGIYASETAALAAAGPA